MQTLALGGVIGAFNHNNLIASSPPSAATVALVNTKPFLAASVARLVTDGVKDVPLNWIIPFAHLAGDLAERPSIAVCQTADVANVLLEIAVVHGWQEDKGGDFTLGEYA